MATDNRVAVRYSVAAASISVIGTGVLALFGFPPLSSFLAFALIAICGYRTVQYHLSRTTGFPTVAIIAAAFALQYALPVFLSDRTFDVIPAPAEISESSLVPALLLTIVGVVTFLVATNAGPLRTAVDRLPTLNLHLDRRKAVIFCIVMGTISAVSSTLFGFLNVEGTSGLAAVFVLIRNQMLIVVGILSWLTYTGAGIRVRAFFYSVVCVAVVAGMSTGMLEPVIAPLVLVILMRWLYTRMISKKLVLLIVAIVVVLNPVKAQFREGVLASPNVSGPAKMSLWLQQAAAHWTGSDTSDSQSLGRADDARMGVMKRLDLIDALAFVYESTPARTPYVYGQTYEFFLYAWIPRFLWPEKPLNANTVLPIKYWITTPEGAETSTFGIGLLGEGYANFGFAGILFVMLLSSLMLLIMQRLFGTEQSGPGGSAILLAFIVFFINGVGSNAVNLFGNVLQSMIVSYLLLYWATIRPPLNRQGRSASLRASRRPEPRASVRQSR